MAGWFDGVSQAGRDVYADDRAGLSRGAAGRGREVRVSLRSARQVHSLREWTGAATGAAADEGAGEGIIKSSKKAPGQPPGGLSGRQNQNVILPPGGAIN